MVGVRTLLIMDQSARLHVCEATTTMTANNVQAALNNLDTRLGSASVMRLPTAAASVTGLATDTEVGITTSVVTTYNLPTVAAWSAVNVSSVELTIKDISGQAATNNVTISPSGGDTIVEGTTKIVSNFGDVRLRPKNSTTWYKV